MSKMSELHATLTDLMHRDRETAAVMLNPELAHRWGVLTAGDAVLETMKLCDDLPTIQALCMAHDAIMSMLAVEEARQIKD